MCIIWFLRSLNRLPTFIFTFVGFYPTHARFRFLSFWLTRSAARVGGNLSSSVEKVFYTLFMFNTSILRVPLLYNGLVLGWFSPVLSFGQRIGAIGALLLPKNAKFRNFYGQNFIIWAWHCRQSIPLSTEKLCGTCP